MIFLYCSPALRDILLTSMPRYSLFVLKVPLNTKQTNKLPFQLASVVISRLECTRVHFVQVSVSRPDGWGLGLGLETWRPRSRPWSQDSMLGAYACSTITVICSTFKWVLCHQLELMQPVMWSRDLSALEFILSRSRDLKTQISVLVSRPEVQGLGLVLET